MKNFLIALFLMFTSSFCFAQKVDVVVALAGTKSSEPMIEQVFKDAYGLSWAGRFTILENTSVPNALNYAKQNGYNLVIRNTGVSGYTNLSIDSFYKSGIQVITCSGSNGYRVQRTNNYTLTNIITSGSGLFENVTSYPCEFWSDEPYGKDTIMNIIQGGKIFPILGVNRVSSTSLLLKTSGSTNKYDFEHGIPIRISGLSGIDIQPIPNGLYYLSHGDNNTLYLNFNTTSGTINRLQIPTSGEFKYGTSDQNTFLRLSKWNLAYPGYGYTFYNVTGFSNNINGIFPIAKWVNEDWYGDKIEIAFNVGTGLYTGGGKSDFSTQSYSHAKIAGLISYVKDFLNCSWWEARYRCRVTASENNLYDVYNGFGSINVNAAINFTGTIPIDPYDPYSIRDSILIGDSQGSSFGFSTSNAGDINNDGYNDLIVGGPFDSDNGQISLFYGSNKKGYSINPNQVIQGNQLYSQFGHSVAGVGDINKDGYDDVLISQNHYNINSLYLGRVFLYYGSYNGLILAKTFTGQNSNAGFGYTINGIGDVNNDGYTDFGIGEPLYNSSQGRVHLYYGSSSGPQTTANKIILSDQTQSQFGISFGKAGDINNDGYDDLIVGANTYDNPNKDQGCVFAYYGSSVGIKSAYQWKSPSLINTWFTYVGGAVSTVGDINKDGFDDIAIGAIGYENGAVITNDEGAVFVYHGSNNGLSQTYNWMSEGNNLLARFGNSLAYGDLNNDNYSDLIVGAYGYNNLEGKVFAFYGSNNGLSLDVKWSKGITTKNTGYANSISCIDNKVIVGAYGYQDKGGVFIYQDIKAVIPTLNLKLSIEGLYDRYLDKVVVDSINVIIRKEIYPYEIIDSIVGVMNEKGNIILKTNKISDNKNYYIVIKHRNSLETWSRLPQQIVNDSMKYDFTISNSVYGNNSKLLNGKYHLYSGDIDQNGTIDLTDLINVYNDANNFIFNYIKTDIDGNNYVDFNDVNIVYNNFVKYISKKTPLNIQMKIK